VAAPTAHPYTDGGVKHLSFASEGFIMRRSTCLVAVVIAVLGAKAALAETVELANGEVLRGTVISLDAKTLKFQSESLGEVSIAREKVSMILLGSDRVLSSKAAPGFAPAAAAEAPSLEGLFKQLQKAGSEAPGGKPITPDDLLKQLQDSKSPELDEIKKNLPLFAAPEVQDYFRKQVGGLLDGSITVNDVRQEAIRARDETKAAVKELGPDAEKALAPYLGILERFIRESEPKATPAAPPTLPVPAPIPPK
jgi:hypothetical protein